MKTGLLAILAAAFAAAIGAGISLADDAAPSAAGVAQSAEPAADAQAIEQQAAAGDADAAAVAEAGTAAAPVAPSDDAALASAPADASADPSEALPSAPAATGKVAIGEVGYDEQGRSGRVHVVVPGDTLWDISDAYLGTPWVWPSVWTDNRDIENPHLIVPGDRIWITAFEMRRVSEEEAERLLAGKPLAANAAPGEAVEPPSTAFQSLLEGDPAPNRIRVSSREATGLITPEEMEAAASIVSRVPARMLLSQADRIYIGLGDRETSVGDQFSVIRTEVEIYDPETNRLLGYHVKHLGWVEVEKTDAETSLAEIRMSTEEIEVGDRLIPREKPVLDIELLASPKNVNGRISFFPASRVLMGGADYVYLNRGELDGLQVGSPLEVYRKGFPTREQARDTTVNVPDHVIAELLVVRAQRETAVALVRHADTELELGDHFRGASE
ncbi:MAG TPA: LysM domain-containing protein [Myxococcota bacterium]|nr:LysM domain-containing protein [Myxococcota bacterium]